MMLKEEIERLNGLLRIKDEEISSWELRYRELERQIHMLKEEIERLTLLLRQREQDCNDWELRYRELENQGVTIVQEKVTYLSQEVEVWKQRFIKVNHEFNQCQE